MNNEKRENTKYTSIKQKEKGEDGKRKLARTLILESLCTLIQT